MKKDKEPFGIVVGVGNVDTHNAPATVTLIAEGKIKPFQFVVPGEKQGRVRALREDEPLYIMNEMTGEIRKNPKIIGHVVPLDPTIDSNDEPVRVKLEDDE